MQPSAERFVIAATVAVGVVAIWPGAYDAFYVPKATVIAVGAVALIATWATRLVLVGKAVVPVSPVLVPAAAFLAALAVTAFLGNPSVSIVGAYARYTGLLPYVAYLVLFVGVLAAYTPAKIPALVVSVLAAGAIVAVYGLVQAVGADPYEWRGASANAVVSTLGNPNFAASFCGVLVPLATWTALNRDWMREVRLGGGATAVMLVGVAVATGSVQGPLTAAAGLGAFLIGWAWVSAGRWRSVAVPALAIVGVSAAAVIVLGVVEKGPISALADQRGIELRRHYWAAAGAMAADHPTLGVGLEEYAAHYREYRSEEAARAVELTVDTDAPHSVPLEVFAEGGVLLGLAYMFFVASVGWLLVVRVKSLDSRSPSALLLIGVGAAWFAYHVQSLVSIDVPPLAALHWVLAGAVVVLAAPPSMRVLALPGSQPGRRRRGRRASPTRWQVVAAGAVVLLAALAASAALRPFRADIARLEARTTSETEDRARAVEKIEASVDLASWRSEYWFDYGLRLGQAGRAREAMQAFEEAIDRKPNALEPLLRGAALAYRLGDQDRAEQLFNRALEVEPNKVEVKVDAIRFNLATGDRREAVALVREAAADQPRLPEFWRLAADVYQAVGDEASAKRARRQASRLSGRS